MKNVFLVMFCFHVCVINAQQKATWDYPLKPGMDEWNQLKTEEERIAAVQVPEDILKHLSSEELVQLVITFPLFGDYGAFSTPQNDGFYIMRERFNVFGHLLTRKDAGKHLIAVYKDAGMKGFNTLPYSNKFWTFKMDYIELVLTQRNIMLSLTSAEKLDLLIESMKKFSEKINDDAFSSLPGLEPSIRIMASILDLEEYQEFTASRNREKLTCFIQTGVLNDVSLIDEIIRISDDYINSKKHTL